MDLEKRLKYFAVTTIFLFNSRQGVFCLSVDYRLALKQHADHHTSKWL